MSNLFKKIKSRFLYFTGNLKVFKWPFWLVYDPVVNRLTGAQIRLILNAVKPGDIVARGYKDYLDALIIPGKYSHTGVYVGNGKVIHAVAEGVCETDILDFLQCDCAAIIRLRNQDSSIVKKEIDEAISRAHSYIGTKYDYFFTDGDDAFYCHEFTASCFKECNITKQIARMSGWLRWIKKKDPVYLVNSFIDNPNFEVIIEQE